MISRTPGLLLAAIALLTLSACSAAGSGETSSGTEGTIKMAVSETCTDVSDSQCISINGESVLLPATYDAAGVKNSRVADDGQNAIDVTFTKDGATIFHTLGEKAAGAGPNARLVIKIGDEIKAAVVVMEASDSDQVQILLSPDDSPKKIVALIQPA